MWLFVLYSGPADRLAARELADMALMAALLGRPVRLLLMGDAVLHLFQGGESPLADLKDLLAGPCLVDSGTAPEALQDLQSAALGSKPAGPADIRGLFRECSQVVNF